MHHRPLTPSGFGWELPELDPDTLQDAFLESGGLLLIRNRIETTPAELIEIAGLLGELEKNEKYDPEFLLPGHPEILRIGNARGNGRYRSLFVEADPPPLLWHSDDSFRMPQPLGSCLFCVETPPQGGETGFAGMTAAYDALSEGQKRRLDGLVAVHSYEHLNEYLRKRNPHRPPLSAELVAKHPPVERPLVAEHPVTRKKSLCVPKCHIASIGGLSPEETEMLLTDLLERATAPDFAWMHRWAPGDIVLWDNRCTLHAPTPFDAERHQRLLYRLTIAS